MTSCPLRMPALLPLALALSSLFTSAASAQEQKSLPTLVVSGSRFPAEPADSPIGATVITADQIRESGIGNVNEAIRRIGGIRGRQNFNGTQDFSLDVRGFGTNSDQNMVILVDGIRISENELTPALLSAVPIELVERIEIVRGGSSVLYGEGATGGIVQVITKRAALNQQRGTVVAEVGGFNHREVRASVSKGWDALSVDANIGSQRADNFRANNEVKQQNFSGGLQWADKDGKMGIRVDVSRQDSRLPGALTMAQYLANPRQTGTPNDFGSIDTDKVTMFVERKLGAFELAAELSHREKTSTGVFVSAFGTFDSVMDSRVTQFSPRMRHRSGSGEWRNELVMGLDFSRWNRLTNSNFAGAPSSRADASQDARALYVRDEFKSGKARVALGARTETFDKDSVDPVPFTTATYSTKQRVHAWELQGNYTVQKGIDLFAKAGRSYRIANVDENGSTPVANQPLAPQTSRDLELGATVGNVQHKATVRVFQHRLKNEIFFDPTAGFFGANSNLDPTRRRGIEVEATTRLAPSVNLLATLQHVSAKFTDGPNAGRDVVLVPHNTATLKLNWQPGSGHSADAGLQWVDKQRYGGDFTNACTSYIPSYTTLDARYAYRTRGWEFAVSGSNLTDKRYFSNAFGACNSGIYPDAGRQLKVTARFEF